MSELRSKKVEFEVLNERGDYDLENVVIRKMRFEAFQEVLDIINATYQMIQADESLRVLFEELFSSVDDFDKEALENFTPEELAEIKEQNKRDAEKRFFQGVMGSFPLLLVHLPKQAKELIVTITGLDRKLLDQQDFETVLDVYDAVLEVNSVEKLYDRLKKSFGATKRAIAFLNKRKKATAE